MYNAYISRFHAGEVCHMTKYSDIYDPRGPEAIVIFNESLQTFLYIRSVG